MGDKPVPAGPLGDKPVPLVHRGAPTNRIAPFLPKVPGSVHLPGDGAVLPCRALASSAGGLILRVGNSQSERLMIPNVSRSRVAALLILLWAALPLPTLAQVP